MQTVRVGKIRKSSFCQSKDELVLNILQGEFRIKFVFMSTNGKSECEKLQTSQKKTVNKRLTEIFQNWNIPHVDHPSDALGPGACEHGILFYTFTCPFTFTRPSHLHWRARFWRSFPAIRKEAGLFCGSFLRKGEVFAYVGRMQKSKDLKRKWRN